MKKYVFPALLLISGCCLSFLMVQPNKTGLIILAIGVLCSATFAAYCYKTSDKHDFSIKKRSNLLSVLFAAVIVGFVGFFDGGLPTKYGDSGFVSSVFEKIGIDKTLGLTVLAAIICLLALPVVYAFFVFLQENSDKEDDSVVGRFFSSNAFFYSCFTIGLLLCGCMIMTSFSYDITIDDAFSLRLIENNFIQITELTANDFHPPLYYYLLKIFASCLSFTGINQVFLGKVFSVIPYIILLVFCFFRYRKTRTNSYAYGISILLYACFWCAYSQTMQIRMYTWGLLFVTFVFIEAKKLICEDKGIRIWIRLSFFSLLCCYTQYFAGVTAVMIYGLLGGYFLIAKRKMIGQLLVSGIAVVIGYSPWLLVLYRQFSQVEGDKKTLYMVSNTFSGYLNYFITAEYIPDKKWFPELFFLIFLLLVLPRFILFCCSHSLSQSAGVIMGVLSVIMVALFGDIMSLIGNPILLPRYLFMALLCAIIAVCFVLEHERNRLKLFLCCWICAMMIIQTISFCKGQHQSANEAKIWHDTLLSENDDTVYVEELAFDGRIIKQITGNNVENFIEKKYAADYYEHMKKCNPLLINTINRVIYGEDYVLHESQNSEYLIDTIEKNESIVAVLFHPEIATDLEQTGMVQSEFLCDCVHGSQVFRFSFSK